MINNQTLELLLQLQQEKQDLAEKALSSIEQNKVTINSEITLLLTEKQKYQQQLQNKAQNGINSAVYNHYCLFIESFDNKLLHTRQKLVNLQAQEEIIKKDWIECKKNILIYSSIIEKQQKAQRLIDFRIEQKDQDQWATRNYYIKHKDDK